MKEPACKTLALLSCTRKPPIPKWEYRENVFVIIVPPLIQLYLRRSVQQHIANHHRVVLAKLLEY